MRIQKRVMLAVAMSVLGLGCSSEVDSAPHSAAARVNVGQIRNGIINGQDADPGEWPWQVVIYTQRNSRSPFEFACGGMLLSDRWVLTAAHCFDSGDRITPVDRAKIVVGDHVLSDTSGVEQEAAIAEVAFHPHWGVAVRDENNARIPGARLHDLALVRLATPVELNESVQPIDLARDYLPPGTEVWATGWGRTDPGSDDPSDVLQELRTQVVDSAECKSEMLKLIPDSERVLASNICIGSLDPIRGSCRGDSGGPLVTREENGRWSLVGASSWGFPPCNAYSIYTDVRAHSRWIHRTMTGSGPVCSGRTLAGHGDWQTSLGGQGVQKTVDTSPCDSDHDAPLDFAWYGPTMYFTSLGGTGELRTTQGATSIYSTTETSFSSRIFQGGLNAERAESERLHVNWESLRPNIIRPTICTGNSGAWVSVTEDKVYVNVDLSHCGFDEPPVIITSLQGRGHHTANGANAIYTATASGFQVFVQKHKITESRARERGWWLNWQALAANTNDEDFCAGRTPPGATAWERTSDGLRAYVDTSACGETRTPLYLSSLGGDRFHGQALGAAAIHSPTPEGFTVALVTDRTVEEAKLDNWHVNWKVLRSTP